MQVMKINILILLLVNGIVNAQNNISKLYARADSQSFSIQRMVPMKDGGFAFNDGAGLMIKNDSNGNLIWSKKYSLPVGYSIESISPTLDDGLITSVAMFNQAESVYFKVNANGNLAWSRKASLSNQFFCTYPNNGLNILSTLQTFDSGYVSHYEVRNFSALARCVVINKTDKTGAIVWTRNFTIPEISKSFMAINSSGDIYVYGLYELPNSVNQAAYILKINLTGNLIWAKKILGDNIRIIELSATSNNLIVTLVDKKNNNTFNHGILNLTTAGSLKWQKFSNTDFYSPIEDANNNFIFVKSNGIVKLDSNGNLDWSRSLPVSGLLSLSKKYDYLVVQNDPQNLYPKYAQLLSINKNGTSLACVGSGTISFLSDSIQVFNEIVTLDTFSVVKDTVYNGITSSNVSLIVTNGCLASNLGKSISNLKTRLSIFPNPTNGLAEVRNSDGIDFSFEIFDALGKPVYSKENNAPHCQMDLRTLSKGLYFYKIKTKTGNQYANKLILN